ncbi:MAG: hypothetical protein ABI445_22060 [Polyangia bacterium]
MLLLSTFLGACVAPPVEAPQTTVEEQTNVETAQTIKNKVDLLFMVDNSFSMDAMQAELLAKFPSFLQAFDKLAHPTDGSSPQYPDLHIGVVTSDYGAGAIAGGGCDASPGGQHGLIQAVGAAADSSCKAPMGSAYIQYAYGASGDTCNIPGGCSSASLGAQFTCAASVGSKGCGFEHQLESVYAALTSTAGTNAGFLRPDAILAVVFVTNEDDSSSPPNVDFFNSDPNKVAQYGAYTTYRQTHFGIACGMPPVLTPEGSSNGALTCEPAPNTTASMVGGEYDISRYTDLFTTPGKLKANPATDVILVAIDAPTTPFETILANTGTGNGKSPSPSYTTCSTLGTNCIAALQHSCQNTVQPAFFGDPPLRLDAVIKNQKLNTTSNICGDDPSQTPDYSASLAKVAGLIVSALKPSCLLAPLKTVTLNGSARPDCVVQDVVGSTVTTLPYCPDAPNTFPCWQEQENPQCTKLCDPTTGKLVQPGITIDRNGQKAPDGDQAAIACNTIALANQDPYAACGGSPDGGT